MTTSDPRTDTDDNHEATWTNPTPTATAARIAIAVACVSSILTTATTWTNDNASVANTTGWINSVAILLAGILYVVWLTRAYDNATQFTGPHNQRHSRQWAGGWAWIVPIVNFWYPYQVMVDIWRASPPRRPAPPATLVATWFTAWLATDIIYLIQEIGLRTNTLEPSAALDTISTAVLVIAGALVIPMITTITRWQTTPRSPEQAP
jgi:hypothetical protein